MDQEKIGKVIAALRRERGLTQEALGEKLNVSQRSVSRWETGKNMPDISLLTPLADTLGVSVTELLGGEKKAEDTFTRQEASDAVSALIALAENRRRLRGVICAVIAAVVTLACMLALYNYEFCVSPTSAPMLEQAINDYRFNDEAPARILRWTSAGNRMFVLYAQEGREGAGGLAELERGVFGKYRVVSANNFNAPVSLWVHSLRHKNDCLAVYSVGSVRGADSIEVCALTADPYGDFLRGQVLYTQRLDGAPFLAVLPLADGIVVSSFKSIRYLDAGGNEVSDDVIRAQNPVDQDADLSGYGSAELGAVYVYEGILLVLGIIFVRYFLPRKQ